MAGIVSVDGVAARSLGWSKRWLALGLLVVLAVGVAWGYTHWWTKPTTFTPVGNGFASKQSVHSLHPVTYDMVQRSLHQGPETITLSHVSPRIVTNTAGAVITFAVCHRSGTPFMNAVGSAARACDTVAPVPGRRITLAPDEATTITMTVTPRNPGKVVIRGMNVDYRRGPTHGWQHGSQATGPFVTMRVTP